MWRGRVSRERVWRGTGVRRHTGVSGKRREGAIGLGIMCSPALTLRDVASEREHDECQDSGRGDEHRRREQRRSPGF